MDEPGTTAAIHDREFFRHLVENTLDVITVLSAEGRVVYNSPAFERDFGFAPGELNGQDVTAFIHPNDRDRIGAVIVQILTGELESEQAEFQFQHRDGHYRYIQAVARRWGVDGDTGLLVNSRDITEQHHAQQELASSNELLSEIFSSSSNALCLNNPVTGLFYDVNDAFLRIMGYERDEVIGKTTVELNIWGTEENRQRTLDEIAANDGRLTNFRAKVYTKSGEEKIALIDTRYLSSGNDLRILFSCQDITEILRTEENLRQAQKMEAVGRLTGGVAHDFNNLIGVVLGNAELLQIQLKGRTDLEELTQRIIAASNRAATLTGQLLAFSRRQTLLPESLNLGATVEAMTPLLKTSVTEKITLEVQTEQDLWLCLIDQAQFENAVLNLTLNAKDAMPSGGSIKFRITNIKLDGKEHQILLDGAPEGDYVQLCITDYGIGMSEDVLGKVFEPFFTTKALGKGTGMGLSMVFGFVKQSNGLIDVQSNEGEGTEVSLYFPRSEVVVEEPVAEETKTPILSDTGQALVIEDNIEFRQIVRAHLEGAGYSVFECSGEKDLADAVIQMNSVDLIVSDILLEGSSSGIDLVTRIRANFPNCHVLYMTGYAASEAVKPGDICLEKPFSRQQFFDAIATMQSSA